jgi:hypothetical protein
MNVAPVAGIPIILIAMLISGAICVQNWKNRHNFKWLADKQTNDSVIASIISGVIFVILTICLIARMSKA